MPEEIDYDFISEREGSRKLVGYVPAASVSSSGVTVATGFDLGCRNQADLIKLGLGAALIAKLKPYLGKVKKTAEDLLVASPLTITASEAEEIDKAVKKAQVGLLKSRYLAAAGNTAKVDFFELAVEAQTVIASVSFQYGDLATKAPKFWSAVTAQKWKEAADLLRDFGDVYKTRRKLEAELLDAMLAKPDAAVDAGAAVAAPPP